MQRQKIEPDAGGEEQHRQDRRGAGQGVRRAAGGEQAAHATATTAHAQRAAFGSLQQDEDDERDRDDQLGDKQQGLHGLIPVFGRVFRPFLPIWEVPPSCRYFTAETLANRRHWRGRRGQSGVGTVCG